MRRLLLLLLVPLCIPVSVVEVSDGTLRCSEVLRGGGCAWVEVLYLHSVERTRVEELYDVCDGGIMLRRMAWQSFGAGLPDEYDFYSDGSYVSNTHIEVGRALSCWFLPLNCVEIRVDGRLVLDALQEPSRVDVRVRYVPVVVWLTSRAMCRPAGL